MKIITITLEYNGVYTGQLNNGKFHGYGKKIFYNGDIYDGNWKDGYEHGKGVYTCGKKKIIGMWVDGVLVKGTYTIPNNNLVTNAYGKCVDKFVKYYLINREKYVSSDGTIISGEWKIPQIFKYRLSNEKTIKVEGINDKKTYRY